MKSTLITNSSSSISRRKQLLFAIVFLLLATPILAQNAFDKFDGQDDVTSVIVNKKMFEMMSKVKIDATDKEMQQYLHLIKRLNTLKVFTTKSARVEAEMKATAEHYTKAANLDELMRVNSNGGSVKISVKSGVKDTQVKELLMFIDGGKGEDSVLMSLTGDFDLSEISTLTDKMRFPGADDLKKATKGKK